MGLFDKIFNRNAVVIPEMPVNYSSEKFHMDVEDVFTIVGRGTAITGRVSSGELHVGDFVTVSGRVNVEVVGIEKFRKKLDYVKAGDVCGIFLKDITRSEINRGDYIEK